MHPAAGDAVRVGRRFARGTKPQPITAALRPWETPEAGDGMWRETWRSRIARRMITVPALFLATALYLALLPVFCVYGLVADTIRRRPQFVIRFHLLMFSCLVAHIIGLVAMFLMWLASLRWLGLRHVDWRGWNLGLERRWGSGVIRIPEVLYGMKMEVEGDECFAPGPVVVFARHTSIIDTMMPLRIVENWHGMVARIVKKHVLLWDPCVDTISQRLPRTFVKRGSNDHAGQLEMVKGITGGMGEGDVLWMYPEGTRFTPKKQQRVFERLRERHPEALERAQQFRYTLPPRPGGTMALLEQCEGMDVVFCAHTGMELANRLENFLDGSLYNRKVKVEVWRVPAADIPKDPEGRLAWMHEQWLRVDRWVEAHQDADITERLKAE